MDTQEIPTILAVCGTLTALATWYIKVVVIQPMQAEVDKVKALCEQQDRMINEKLRNILETLKELKIATSEIHSIKADLALTKERTFGNADQLKEIRQNCSGGNCFPDKK